MSQPRARRDAARCSRPRHRRHRRGSLVPTVEHNVRWPTGTSGQPVLEKTDPGPASAGARRIPQASSADGQQPTQAGEHPGAGTSPLPPKPRVAGLADIPDMPQNGLSPSMELPKVDISPQAAEAIAKEYERELRERLAATVKPETFWSKNALFLGGGAVIIVLGVVATQVFFRTKKATINVADMQAKARVGLDKDTRASYQATLDALSDLLSVSSKDGAAASAQAMSAYVHALLYREHGGEEADRTKAFAALEALAALPDAAKQAPLSAAAPLLPGRRGGRTTASRQGRGQSGHARGGGPGDHRPPPRRERPEEGHRPAQGQPRRRQGLRPRLRRPRQPRAGARRAAPRQGELRGRQAQSPKSTPGSSWVSPGRASGWASSSIKPQPISAAIEKDAEELDESNQAALQLVSAP